ncbi:MAG: tRNA-dihydrouridine synthase family protein [Sedimentisphaerales bacterium]|nr:tRNA-dihydrouridine synthase family protein [Sedimentisphaerales bacterium]
MLNIGRLKLDVPFYQAPLSGYTDRGMRRLARRFGCPLTFTGVLLDKIALNAKAIKKLHFQPCEDEHPVGAQILGEDPKTMSRSAAMFQSVGFDAIDLNFACPAPKVLRRGRGGALLNTPSTIIETLERVKEAVTIPILMKLRIGWDESSESKDLFWEICERAAALEPDAVGIHGRTVSKKYRGKADWNTIAQVKHRFPSITVIGSGDLMTAKNIAERIGSGDVDGVMIARGAIGNPWIFHEARALLEGQPTPPAPSVDQVGRLMLEHIEMILAMYPPRKAVPFFRKFAVHYCKRHPQRKKALLDILAAKSPERLRSTVSQWFSV